MKLLVIVDMQNDFIDGALGSEAAQAIVPNVVKKIETASDDTITIFTKDTHYADYCSTLEGQKLPVPHCIYMSHGWNINIDIRNAWFESNTSIIEDPEFRENNVIIKDTFGSDLLMNFLKREGYHFDEIEFIGVCTDICVVSNAILARAALPNTKITVDASCCAGTSVEKHNAALETMKSCQIDVINEE